MGMEEGWLLQSPAWQAFLYVSSQRRVLGCAIIEPARYAYPVVPSAGPLADAQPSESAARALAQEKTMAGEGTSTDVAVENSQRPSGEGPAPEPAGPSQAQKPSTSHGQRTSMQQQAAVPGPFSAAPKKAKTAGPTRWVTDETTKKRVACGVRVVWVSMQARRQGIATKLLDCARWVLFAVVHDLKAGTL